MPDASQLRVASLPYDMRAVESVSEFEQRVADLVLVAAEGGAEVAVLPELLTCQILSSTPSLSKEEGLRRLDALTPRLIEHFRELAGQHGLTLIAGSHLMQMDGRLMNVCPICLPDGAVILQPKVHVTPNERRSWGVVGGGLPQAIDLPKARIGVLVCYDVEFPEAVRALEDQGVDVLFVPYCTDSNEGHLRVRYCAHARAVESQIGVVLAGAVGSLAGVYNMDDHVGQGLVLTPSDAGFPENGVAAESKLNGQQVVVADLDLDRLRSCRESGSVTPRMDRRTDLYSFGPVAIPSKERTMGDGEVESGSE